MLGWSEKDAERILGARREVSLIKYALMRRRLKKEKKQEVSPIFVAVRDCEERSAVFARMD